MVGRPQTAAQDVLAADDEERQEAMVVVIAVEVLALLVAMHRIVGGIKIQNNLLGRCRMALQKQVHKKTVQCFVIGHDLLVAVQARLIRIAEFQAVQRARGRQHMSTVPLANPSRSLHIVDPASQGQSRVVTQTVMIVEILVTRSQSDDALRHQCRHIVFNATGITIINKSVSNTLRHVEKPVCFPQQKRTTVGGHAATIEIGHNLPPSETFKLQLLC